MGLLSWIFGRGRRRGVVVGDGEFEYHLVGTSHYQAALETICGGKTRDSAHHFCAALVTPQPNNPYDRHAVVVAIFGMIVGHLDRDDAREFIRALRHGGYADAACEASIVGGWDRGHDDTGYFGVRLNAALPFEIFSPEQWRRVKAHRRLP